MPLDGKLAPAVLRGAAIIDTVHKYFLAKTKAKKLEADLEALKAEILAAMGNRSTASVGNHIVRLTDVPDTPYMPNRIITKAMIGQVIVGSKGRSGGTRLEVL